MPFIAVIASYVHPVICFVRQCTRPFCMHKKGLVYLRLGILKPVKLVRMFSCVIRTSRLLFYVSNLDVFICSLAPSEKLNFELEVALVSSSSWVTAPNHLCMWAGGIV